MPQSTNQGSVKKKESPGDHQHLPHLMNLSLGVLDTQKGNKDTEMLDLVFKKGYNFREAGL